MTLISREALMHLVTSCIFQIGIGSFIMGIAAMGIICKYWTRHQVRKKCEDKGKRR